MLKVNNSLCNFCASMISFDFLFADSRFTPNVNSDLISILILFLDSYQEPIYFEIDEIFPDSGFQC